MNTELVEALEMLEREKNIPKETSDAILIRNVNMLRLRDR